MERLANLCLLSIICSIGRYFGYQRLKSGQIEAVMSFCKGKDVFVSLPTGYGKTLIYAILPLLFNVLRRTKSSIVLVVSPLAALMAEQKKRFVPMVVNAEFLGELQTDPEAVDRVTKGLHNLVLVSPENLCFNCIIRDMLLNKVYQQNLVGFVVDEAHCINAW